MSETLKEDKFNLRSEEVQEIISTPPIWIVRWGITLVFIFVCILLVLSSIIKYPDVVSSKILVTTKFPIEHIVSRHTGQLDRLFVKNRDTVAINQTLAVMKNAASTKSVYKLKKIVDTTKLSNLENFGFPIYETRNLILGDIQSAYINFEKSYLDYFLLKDLNPFANELEGNKISLKEIKTRLKNQILQKKILDDEFRLIETQFKRQKRLFEKGIISKENYETKKLEFLEMQKRISNMSISISQIREAITSAKQDIGHINIREKEQNIKLYRSMLQSYDLLKEAIKNWEYNYVLSSSINGIVSFQEYWGENQFVAMGSQVFTVLPLDTSQLVGKLSILAQNMGKVASNQKVLVKLDNYPYQQYGFLRGAVENMSVSPDNEGNYIVYVSLPEGMKTSYNKTLKFSQELLGVADIITDELSVAERLFFKLKGLTN